MGIDSFLILLESTLEAFNSEWLLSPAAVNNYYYNDVSRSVVAVPHILS